MKFILGYKLRMTQVFTKDGAVLPVTQIQAGPCIVTQVKKMHENKTSGVQIGFIKTAEKKLNKATLGHLKGLAPMKYLAEFRMKEGEQAMTRGQNIDVSIFQTGDIVKVTGISKGKGFQGVVKRHHFSGGKKSHGHKDQLRMPGSIGGGHPQRVRKGKRMGGHTGCAKTTVKNLTVVSVDKAKNVLLVAGAVPGATGGLLKIASK